MRDHITDWPAYLNGDSWRGDMFDLTDEERDFWEHLVECERCRGELPKNLGDAREVDEVLEEDFWGEVRRYLDDIHPSVEHLAQASIDYMLSLMATPAELFEAYHRKHGDLMYHLSICSECVERCRESDAALLAFYPDLHALPPTKAELEQRKREQTES